MERKRPGALLTVAIIGIVLGGLGGCLGIYTLGITAFQGAMSGLTHGIENMQPTQEQRDFQREVDRRTQEVQQRYRLPIFAHQSLNVLASLALLAGSIFLLQWKPNALVIVPIAVLANAVVDMGGSVVQYFMQRDTTAVVTEALTHLPNAGPTPPGFDRTMQGMMGASAAMGVCWLVVVLVLKLAFYAWAGTYTRRPDVRHLFSPQ